MKKIFTAFMLGAGVCCGAFLYVHRRVIVSRITGTPLSEGHDSHKKCCCHGKKQE